MIGTIRKHQRWLWALIIGVTIVTFVIFFNPSSRLGRGGDAPTADLGSINGEKISLDDFQNAQTDEEILFVVHYGKPPTEALQRQYNFNLSQQTYEHLFALAKMKELGIAPNDAAGAGRTKQMFGVPHDQPMPKDKLDQLAKILAQNGLTTADFARFVRNEAGENQMMALFGMSGKLITPKEAEAFYRRDHEPASVEMVSFSATNYLALIHPSESDITNYFAKQQSVYRIKEQVRLNYVRFDLTNFYAEAEKQLGGLTNIDHNVELAFAKDPSQFKDEDGKPMTLEVAKAKTKEYARNDAARRLAQKPAAELIAALYDGHDDAHPFTVDDLGKAAQAKGYTVQTTEPFNEDHGPAGLKATNVSHYAFLLQDDDAEDKTHAGLYPTRPVVEEDALYVIGLKQKIPSQLQPLAAVRARVEADYREEQALQMAEAAGRKFALTAQAALAAGTNFAEVCGTEGVRPTTLAPFSRSTRAIAEVPGPADFERLQQELYLMQPGQSSRFVPTENGGFVVYLKARLPVDETQMKLDMPDYIQRFRHTLEGVVFNRWFGKQVRAMNPDIPEAMKKKMQGG